MNLALNIVKKKVGFVNFTLKQKMQNDDYRILLAFAFGKVYWNTLKKTK